MVINQQLTPEAHRPTTADHPTQTKHNINFTSQFWFQSRNDFDPWFRVFSILAELRLIRVTNAFL